MGSKIYDIIFFYYKVMEDISKKRYYIYQNIDKIKNHNHLIDYLKLSQCKYTENKNGIFVNLNTIDDDKIDHFYSLVYDSIHNLLENTYTNNFYNLEMKDIIQENQFKDEIKEDINLNNVYLNNFTEGEKEVIEYSKTYF